MTDNTVSTAVRADLPDPATSPELFAGVLTYFALDAARALNG